MMKVWLGKLLEDWRESRYPKEKLVLHEALFQLWSEGNLHIRDFGDGLFSLFIYLFVLFCFVLFCFVLFCFVLFCFVFVLFFVLNNKILPPLLPSLKKRHP